MIMEQLREGTLLNDRYRILQILGQGGMGTVYLAEHTKLGTHAAVKEVRGVLSNTAELREALTRCEQEGRLLVRLHHPNLPQVTDAFVENDRFYLVMEYIEGETLEAKLRAQNGDPLDVVSVVNWGVQVASVLKYLHEQQPPIIFRDLKPANSMVLADGTVRLIDFGIARRFQKDAPADTDPLGSIGYSPPEQFGDRQTEPRSDIYAFGATMHQMLTGKHPSARPFKFIPARNINPAVPAALSTLLTRCVADDPKARPASMAEVVRTLEAVRGDLPASLRDVHTGTLSSSRLYQALSSGTTRLLGHNRQNLAPILVSVLGVGVFAYVAFANFRGPKPDQPPPQPPEKTTGGTGGGSHSTPEPPPVGYAALHREEGFEDPLEYWFEREGTPRSSPRPLKDFNDKGVLDVGVPADYMKADTRLVVNNTASKRMAKFPLKDLYQQYRKAEYLYTNPPNLLKNGDFRNGANLWKLERFQTPAHLDFRPLDPVVAAKGVKGKTSVVHLDASGKPDGLADLVHTQLYLIESGTYRLRFWARADSEREIGLLTRLNTLGGGSSGLDSMASLSVRWQPFERPFNVSVPPSQREKVPVTFRFTPPGEAQHVYMATSANGWNYKRYPMTRLPNRKTWEIEVPLDAGSYEYKFVVDDGKAWFTDPDAPEKDDGQGHINSVRIVSPRPERHRLSFVLGHGAGHIHIAGVSVRPEGDLVKKPVPEDIKVHLTLKATALQALPEKKAE